MAPNHGGDPLGSILGPMGPHSVKKGSKPYKITIMQNSNFRRPCSHRFFPENGTEDYGAKSRWGTLGSILEPMGSHWVQKMGQNRKNLHAQNFEF